MRGENVSGKRAKNCLGWLAVKFIDWIRLGFIIEDTKNNRGVGKEEGKRRNAQIQGPLPPLHL